MWEDQDLKKAYNSSTKALNLDGSNLEARWVRAQSSALSNSSESINDLTYIVNNGGASAKVYNAIGLVEQEIANNIYRFKRAKENTGFSDDNSVYTKEQTEIYNNAIVHYERAIIAFKKAIEVKPDTEPKLKYKIKDSERNINEIRESIKELK